MSVRLSSVLETTASTITNEDVQGWGQQFEQLNERIAPYFKRIETKHHAQNYLRGLLSSIERKNGWQIAEEVGDCTPDAIQHLLGRSAWQADELRDELRGYVVKHLGHPEAVAVVDESGFLKKGDKSLGVQRQYSGTAGRTLELSDWSILELCHPGWLQLPGSRTLLAQKLDQRPAALSAGRSAGNGRVGDQTSVSSSDATTPI